MRNSAQKIPLLGAVGPLQFEVVQYRLQDEYGAESRLEQTNWKICRWISSEITKEMQAGILLPAGAAWAYDTEERDVFTSEWSLDYFREKNGNFELGDIPFESELSELKKTGS